MPVMDDESSRPHRSALLGHGHGSAPFDHTHEPEVMWEKKVETSPSGVRQNLKLWQLPTLLVGDRYELVAFGRHRNTHATLSRTWGIVLVVAGSPTAVSQSDDIFPPPSGLISMSPAANEQSWKLRWCITVTTDGFAMRMTSAHTDPAPVSDFSQMSNLANAAGVSADGARSQQYRFPFTNNYFHPSGRWLYLYTNSQSSVVVTLDHARLVRR